MWQEKNHALYQEFVFKDFKQAFAFMQAVAVVAEQQQHHPRWLNEYNKVQIWLNTHEENDAITDKDHILAQSIGDIFKKIQREKTDDKKSTGTSEVKLYADGGSRGNPGHSASGFALLTMDDKVVAEEGIYLGITTNNQAEYRALKFGLEKASAMDVRRVDVYMDSLLVINQMLGRFKVKNAELLPIHLAIKDLTKNFEAVSFTHVPRALNKLADSLVNKALDEELKNVA